MGREEGREILEAETKREREGMGKGGSEEGRIREGVREGKGWEQGKGES